MVWYINKKTLISEKQWKEQIDSFTTQFEKITTNYKQQQSNLSRSIEETFKSQTKDLNTFGILFSGGIDSSLLAFLAKKNKKQFFCYSFGLENASDLDQAKKVASYYHFNLKIKTLSLKEFESLIKETITLLKSTEIVTISVGAVTLAAAKLAKQDNEETILSGLGSEELFAGYKRHQDVASSQKQLHEECVSGLQSMWARDLQRDYAIATSLKLKLIMPYVDKQIIRAALQTHPKIKNDGVNNKIVLRKAAIELGLKEEFAETPKKAAQYGSNVVKGLDAVAKKHNFNTKKEYLENLYRKIHNNNDDNA